MALEVEVLIVHGMSSQKKDFADGLIAELNERLGAKASSVCFEPVFWAPILSEREAEVWNNLSARTDLDWIKLRKFFLNAFGDAAAYRYVPGDANSTYYKIHDKVNEGLTTLRTRLGDANKPLVVCAHSLGSVIMSDYILDRQHDKDPDRYGGTAFTKMESLAGFITFGSNIPLFMLDCNPVTCITFPPTTLDAQLKAKAKWLNFFDSDDVLGWPLKDLSDSYRNVVTADREINVGGLLTSWNPTCHSEYWEDDNFTEPVAELIGGFV
jgi:hypothetical protein